MFLGLGVILVTAVVGSAMVSVSFGTMDLSVHGYIALALGIVLSLLLAGGLMALVFFSARRGYDDIDRNGE